MALASTSGYLPGRSSLPLAALSRQRRDGFGWLRFSEDLEPHYRAYHQAISLARLRPAMVILLVFGAVLISVNLQVLPNTNHATVLSLAAVAESIVLLLLLASWSDFGQRHLRSIGLLVAVTLSALAMLLGPISGQSTLSLQFASQLVIVVCVYLMLGLRFRTAAPSALMFSGAFALTASATSLPPALIANYCTFLVFANLIGALALYRIERSRRRHFLEEHVLEHMVSRDALTGLCNRQYMDETFAGAWQDAAAGDTALAVVIVDIDHFKPFNDHYGHQHGDDCLTTVAASLKEAADDAHARVFRYGGEEFVFLLLDVTHDEAEDFGEHICSRVEALGVRHSVSTTAPVVTVSVGVAHASPAHSTSNPHAFLRSADLALYAAKRAGRNRSVMASALDDEPVPLARAAG